MDAKVLLDLFANGAVYMFVYMSPYSLVPSVNYGSVSKSMSKFVTKSMT